MFLSKLSLILWIVCGYPLYSLNMAQNYSDSHEEFAGLNAGDIAIDNDYTPDSDPDLDITVPSVQSGDISSLGEESGESGSDKIGQAEWSQNFAEITFDDFTDESGAKLPDDFNTTSLVYFKLL